MNRGSLGVTLFVSLGVACVQTGGADSDAGFRPVAQDEYVSMLASTMFELETRCCALAGRPPPSNERRATLLAAYSMAEPRANSGAIYNPIAAGQSLAELAADKCFLLKEPFPSHPAFSRIYTGGAFAAGDACESTHECDQSQGLGLECRATVVNGEFVRICATREPLANEGEACGSCAGSLLCDPDTRVCVRRAELGETCLTSSFFGDTCAIGSVCDRGNTQRCVTPTPVGQACEGLFNLCEGGACQEGLCRIPFFATSGSTTCR